MTTAAHIEPDTEPRGFVVRLPIFSANKRLQPVIRYRKNGPPYPEMVPTGKYSAWKREAGQEIMIQRPVAVQGPVVVSIVLVPKTTAGDTDNCIKAALDALVAAGKMDNDTVKTIRRLEVDVWSELDGLDLPIKAGWMQLRVRGMPIQNSMKRRKARSGTAEHGCA